MATAAILCPGPSLHDYPRREFCVYDMTLAVNRAIHYYPADWWCFSDHNSFVEFQPDQIPARAWVPATVHNRIIEDELETRRVETPQDDTDE